MKTIGITLVCLVAVINFLYTQSYCENKYDYVWILGDGDTDTIQDEYGGSEINFNSLPPLLKVHEKLNHSPWQNASMCDKNGKLIFYSNGCSIYNADDLEMVNGDSLNPGEIYDDRCPSDGYVGSQNMISLPDLENDSIYYIFHIDKIFNYKPGAPFVVQSKHAYCTTVILNSDDSLGYVLNKNRVLLDDTSMMGSPVSAVKTADGLGWWVITPDRWTNGFHMFKLENGIFNYVGKQTVGIPPKPDATGGQGKFSSNGKYFAWYQPKNGLFLYDFDRATGALSNFRYIEIDNEIFITGGCEFSPSSQYLYVNHNISLYQLDMLTENIQSSLTHIADYDGFGDPLPTRFFYMERTPDNRIFMNITNGSQYFHVIQEPNKRGTACNFEQHSIKLPTINNFTLPHFPNYRLGALEDSLCDDFIVKSYDITYKPISKYSIVPNPAKNFIQVIPLDGGFYDDYIFYILDLNGRRVITSQDSLIDIQSIPSGMYYCSITNNNYTQITKIIIID